MGHEVTRRGFLKSVGISFGAVLVATTPLKILEANAPKRLDADTAKKRPEPARRSGGSIIRSIEFGDGTTVRMFDWGDYPMYSRATHAVIDVKSSKC